jgi:hypothetical protein
MTLSHPRLFIVIGLTLLAAGAFGGIRVTMARADRVRPSPAINAVNEQITACSLAVSGPRPLRLSDGTLIHLGTPRPVTTPSGTFANGDPVYSLDARGARTGDFVGVLIAPNGAVAGMPQPVPGRRAEQARAVMSARGGLTVLFFLAVPGSKNSGGTLDSAEAWIGHYGEMRWDSVERIGAVYNARVSTFDAPSLYRRDSSLFFVYFAQVSVAGVARSAVIELRSTGRRWRADTVILDGVPASAFLTSAPSGRGANANVFASYFDAKGPHNTGLLELIETARGPTTRVVIANNERYSFRFPTLHEIGQSRIAVWGWPTSDNDPSRLRLHAMAISPSGTQTAIDALPAGVEVEGEYAAGVLGRRLLVLATRAGGSPAVVPFLFDGARWITLPPTRLGDDGFGPFGFPPAIVAQSDSTALLFVSHMEVQATSQTAVTNLYDLRVRSAVDMLLQRASVLFSAFSAAALPPTPSAFRANGPAISLAPSSCVERVRHA